MRLKTMRLGKDKLDAATLIATIGPIDPNLVLTDMNATYVAKLVYPDEPGSYYTITLNLRKIRRILARAPEDKARVRMIAKFASITRLISYSPKPLRWEMQTRKPKQRAKPS